MDFRGLNISFFHFQKENRIEICVLCLGSLINPLQPGNYTFSLVGSRSVQDDFCLAVSERTSKKFPSRVSYRLSSCLFNDFLKRVRVVLKIAVPFT